MYKKLVIASMVMSLMQMAIGGLMIGNILNKFNGAKSVGIIWIVISLFELFLNWKIQKSMKVNLVNKFFWIFSVLTFVLLATCWVNPLTSIALVIYIPITIFYIMGRQIQNKI